MARGVAAKLLKERQLRAGGLPPGTKIKPGSVGIRHGHNPVKDEPFEQKPPVAMSAGLTPGSSGQITKPKPTLTPAQREKVLRERIAKLREQTRREEMKEREVPGGVGVSTGPGSKTAA
jgi:hypothetical protein